MKDMINKQIEKNEEKIEKLEREFYEEMSASESNHTVNWRREVISKIRALREENRELKRELYK